MIRSGSVSDPWGWLLVAVLCALAGAGQAALLSPAPLGLQGPHAGAQALDGAEQLVLTRGGAVPLDEGADDDAEQRTGEGEGPCPTCAHR